MLQHAEEATRVYGQGTFGAILVFRWHETTDLMLPLLAGVAQRTFALMLLGVAVWRYGIVQNPRRHRHLLWAVGLFGGLIGAINTIAELRSQHQPLEPPGDRRRDAQGCA